MSEIRANVFRRRANPAVFDLRRRLDELTRGECSEEQFIRESFEGRGTAADAAWYVLSLLDQRYRLGQLSGDLFQSIKSRIAQRELQSVEFGTTVELIPPATDPAPPPAVSVAPAAEPESMSAPAAPQILAPGRVLHNRYLLEAVIGSGGMATVFRAIDRCGVLPANADRRVAVKVLRERINQKPAILVQLRREFHCTQSLAHPGIVKVYELDRDEDLAFYTMELLEGERLSERIARAQPHPLPRHYAWEVIRAVGSAVAHAHSRNVIHGDLKPQNIMVTHKAEIRVLDFGSSITSSGGDAAQADTQPQSGPLAATPPYACCEILEGRQPDPRDDLFSLACIAYELLSGMHPFESRSSLEARTAGKCPRRPPHLSNRQWQMLQTGLSWSREHRSVPVSEWLMRLGLKIEPHQLPPLLETERARLPAFALPDWRKLAMPAAMALLAAIALFAFHRTPPRAPAALQIAVRKAAAVPPAPVTPPTQSLPAATPAPTADTGPKVTAPARRPAVVAATPAKPRITLTARTYSAGRDSHFVEVRVRRSEESKATQSFVWWTEDGTAKAGEDFTAQTRISRAFSNGRQYATLFIRINPGAERRQARTFYVNIADPGTGTTPGAVTRTTVVLPTLP